jgi:chlorophyllide a reductase subunit Z
MDKVEATPARNEKPLAWEVEAKTRLDELVEAQPVLIRISAAKRLRDAAERNARKAGAEIVTTDCLDEALLEGASA